MQSSAALLCLLLSTRVALAQGAEAGRRHYELLCSRCHGADGNGGEVGPAIVHQLATHTDEELATLVRQGLPGLGMPGFAVRPGEMRALLAFLRELRPPPGLAPVRGRVETTDGRTLEGLVMNQTALDMQLLTDDRRIHLLRRVGDRYRPVSSGVDWPTYHGQAGGNRYSALDQIHRGTWRGWRRGGCSRCRTPRGSR